MKKIISVIMVLCMLVCLSACGECEHEWKKATCEKPAKCKLCGATKGTNADHKWEEATCTEPKTCSECDETEGEALGHDTSELDCTRCGEMIDHYALTEVDPFESVTGVSLSERDELENFFIYKYDCSNYDSEYTDFMEYVEYLRDEGWNIGELQVNDSYYNASLDATKGGKGIYFVLTPETYSYELIVGFSKSDF